MTAAVSSNIAAVLSDIQWDEGFSIPVANASNKELESEIQQKQKEVLTSRHLVEEITDRVNAITDHMKNLRQELQLTQGLLRSRRSEVETEKHMSQLSQREIGRLQQEIKRLESRVEEIKERKNIHENSIFNNTQQLERLKAQMNWDQQALEAWLEESARRDEDAMTLQKYTRQDEAKIKELSLRMEQLTDESAKRRRQLDVETTNTLTAQIELDKTAEEFRKAHQDRQHLLELWEAAISNMQKRDREMDLMADQLADVKREVHRCQEILKEKENFLENEKNNNLEQEKRLQISERQVAKVRVDYANAETQRVQFADELEALKNTVERTNTDLEKLRSNISHMKKDIQEKTKKLAEVKKADEKLAERLKQVEEGSMSAEERVAAVEKAHADEEAAQSAVLAELERLRENAFKQTQEFNQLKAQELNKVAEMTGTNAAIRSMKSKIGKLDKETLKQQEIMYNQDFQIAQLERRIARMEGQTTSEEKEELERRIKELTKTLENRQQTFNLVDTQVKRLADDISRVNRDYQNTSKVKQDYTSKIEELNLHNDSSQRVLRTLNDQKENLLVNQNLLKLEIKRLRGFLRDKSETVTSLEKRQLQLDTAMKERRHEISIHMDMITAQLRSAEEERSQVNAELQERLSKIDKLKKRYEILMVAMKPPEGEEEQSQSYFVIKAAQEKEALQREGDELDAKIKKAEKEIRALQNTLKLLDARNETYRQSFRKVTSDSEEAEQRHQLEEQLRAVMDKYKYKRRQIKELQEDVKTMSGNLDQLQRDEQIEAEKVEEFKSRNLQLGKELEEQQVKLSRVKKLNDKAAAEIRERSGTTGETKEEKDFEVRDLREFNRTMTRDVLEATVGFPDANQALLNYLTQANIPLPTGRSSLGGSRSASTLGGRSATSLSSARSTTSAKSGSGVAQVAQVQIGDEFPPGSARSVGSARSSVSGRR